MKTGFYQFAPRFGDIKYNLQKVIDAAASVETGLLVLPELFNTGYQFTSKEEAKSLSEKNPGQATPQTHSSNCRQRKRFILWQVSPSTDEGKIYNSAVLTGQTD